MAGEFVETFINHTANFLINVGLRYEVCQLPADIAHMEMLEIDTDVVWRWLPHGDAIQI